MFADRMHTFFEDFLGEKLAAGSISVIDFERYPDVLQDSFIELLFAQAHGGGTIGLSGGNITEIKRFILTARGNTKKEVGQLRLLKRKNMIYWGD